MVTAPHVSPGRPRDPDVDRRVSQAALDLFGEAGWAGFAMETVARRAGVGKASLYLRWNSKEALLADAVTMRMSQVTDADTGTVRGDLTELAVQMLDLYAGPSSRAAMIVNPYVPRFITAMATAIRAVPRSRLSRAGCAVTRRMRGSEPDR